MRYQESDYDYEYNNPSDDFTTEGIAIAKTQDFLEGIMESMYTTGNIKTLEHCLEELCDIYDVNFEDKKCLFIKNTMFTKHLSVQRDQINQLMRTK